MEFTRVKLHYHPKGDREIIDSLIYLIEQFDDKTKRGKGYLAIDDNWGDNAIRGTIPEPLAIAIKQIYDQHLKLSKDRFNEGKKEGKNLLMMLNNGEITSESFESR